MSHSTSSDDQNIPGFHECLNIYDCYRILFINAVHCPFGAHNMNVCIYIRRCVLLVAGGATPSKPATSPLSMKLGFEANARYGSSDDVA